MTNKKRTANSAQAQPEKGMRLCAERYKQVYDDRQLDNKPTEKQKKMPTLRKIKRAASRHTSQRFCSTFNFAQPHPKPTLQPTSGRLRILRQLLTETELKNLTLKIEKLK